MSAVRRLLDVAVSALALLALLPLLALIALCVWTTSRGPALHRAERVGRGGRLFRLFKFRSMVVGAAAQGPGITGKGDVRVTPVGRVLRRYKLDELPQLWNVLRGDMSLVGPRPEDPRYVALYTPEQRAVLSVRPGLTSAASVAFADEESLLGGPDSESVYVGEVMPRKLRIELEYLERRSLASDLAVLFSTAGAVFRPRTATRG